jgi:hypothetical protein
VPPPGTVTLVGASGKKPVALGLAGVGLILRRNHVAHMLRQGHPRARAVGRLCVRQERQVFVHRRGC